MSTTIVVPIIHLNSDRPEVLLANLKGAYRAVRAAIAALQECAPNGRNYYPELGRLERARAQHNERLDKLLAVAQSIAGEAKAIQQLA